MIDLTPLDVRNKRGDFKKLMRGYDPQEVDVFLELVAERLEGLVRENLQLRERTQTLQDQVTAQAGREQAVQDALVTAQELRADMQVQSKREVDHALKEAEVEARRLISEAEAQVRDTLRGIERRTELAQDAMQDVERRRARFLKEFRGLLERELDVVRVAEDRPPLEERPIHLDSGTPREAVGLAREPAEDLVEADESSVDIHALEPASSDDVTAEVEATPEHTEGKAEVAVDTVDVIDLQPPTTTPRPSAPPPDIGSEPSSLELELMAGAAGTASARNEVVDPEGAGGDPFAGVPDLETVLAEAEAGSGEAEAGNGEGDRPEGEELAPPPIEGRGEDNLILFDPDEQRRKR